jgi:hypothetical protein
VLQKKSTGKSLYEKIRDKYPLSIYWTNEAKPRVNTVIDTLRALEILKKKAESRQDRQGKNSPPADSLKDSSSIIQDTDLLNNDLQDKKAKIDSLPETKTDVPPPDSLMDKRYYYNHKKSD